MTDSVILDPNDPASGVADTERRRALADLEDWFEGPMRLLGLVWLVLVVVDMTHGLAPPLALLNLVIWIVFIGDFALRLALAPSKRAFLRSNWLTALSLALPPLRALQQVRADIAALRTLLESRGPP